MELKIKKVRASFASNEEMKKQSLRKSFLGGNEKAEAREGFGFGVESFR